MTLVSLESAQNYKLEAPINDVGRLRRLWKTRAIRAKVPE